MYVALNKGGEFSDSKIVETTKEHYHSAFLISTIRDILKENGLTPKNIDVIATNIGPGSFTGIRACTTVARVFAQGVDGIKTVGVSSLEILSRINEAKSKKQKAKSGDFASQTRPPLTSHFSPLTLVALDARKDMAYVAIYENRKEILPPQTMLLEDLKEKIAKNDYFVVTDDKLEPVLGGISYQKQEDDLGKYLVEIAFEKLNSEFNTDWRELHPLYIQPPPVGGNSK